MSGILEDFSPLVEPGTSITSTDSNKMPLFHMDDEFTMRSRLWNMTRVTVREVEERLLARELGMMTSLTHPQLLLLLRDKT